MKRNEIDNAQHCRSIVRRGFRCLEPETTEPTVTRKWVQKPRELPDSFVVLSYTCSDRVQTINKNNCCFGDMDSNVS